MAMGTTGGDFAEDTEGSENRIEESFISAGGVKEEAVSRRLLKVPDNPNNPNHVCSRALPTSHTLTPT